MKAERLTETSQLKKGSRVLNLKSIDFESFLLTIKGIDTVTDVFCKYVDENPTKKISTDQPKSSRGLFSGDLPSYHLPFRIKKTKTKIKGYEYINMESKKYQMSESRFSDHHLYVLSDCKLSNEELMEYSRTLCIMISQYYSEFEYVFSKDTFLLMRKLLCKDVNYYLNFLELLSRSYKDILAIYTSNEEDRSLRKERILFEYRDLVRD